MTPEAFFGWVEQALAGDTCIYHRGFLPLDRVQKQRETMVGQSARLAGDLASAGVAQLTQRRLGEDLYEYRITMR